VALDRGSSPGQAHAPNPAVSRRQCGSGRRLKEVLKPKSVYHLAEKGGTGVPLFDASDLDAFVSEAKKAPPDHPRQGQWWEFWPTTDRRYAMFAADDTRRLSLTTSRWIPRGKATQVRRVDLTSPVSAGMSRLRNRPEPCELLAEAVDPGAPYVGRCENVGCGGGCTPHVVVVPDDGIYRLLGCDC
jgi:hypothetical protein